MHHLLHRPFLALLGIAVHLGRRESVESLVIGRMHGHELSLEMRRQLGDLDAVLLGGTPHFIAIRLGFGRLLEIDEPWIPACDLHALVAERSRPFADRVERVERRLIARELRQKNRGSFYGLGHFCLSLDVTVEDAFEIFLPPGFGLGIDPVLLDMS